MSLPPPPPGPPGDDPTSIASWVKIGGLLVLVVTIIAVTQLNRGGGGKPRPPAAAPSTATSALPSETPVAAATGTYRIVFEGTATGHVDRPDPGQTFRSRDATATWHLEYTYGDNHDGTPDPTTSSVKGSGHSMSWHPEISGGCNSSAVIYTPYSSLLRAVGGNRLRVGVPFGFDTTAADCAPSEIDPYFGVVGGTCATGPSCLPADFWLAYVTIAPGQTGTVVTPIAARTGNYSSVAAGGAGGENTKESWSGSITVIAQP